MFPWDWFHTNALDALTLSSTSLIHFEVVCFIEQTIALNQHTVIGWWMFLAVPQITTRCPSTVTQTALYEYLVMYLVFYFIFIKHRFHHQVLNKIFNLKKATALTMTHQSHFHFPLSCDWLGYISWYWLVGTVLVDCFFSQKEFSQKSALD